MSSIKLFQDKKIRTTFSEIDQKWYFAIIDVVQVLTESSNARRYWSDLKRKLVKEGYNELYENIVQLKLEAPDGKLRETDCANTEGLLLRTANGRIQQNETNPNHHLIRTKPHYSTSSKHP